ncbi:PREDICTED: GDSL esterase/lipase At1g71691-like [Ipomoea nil]|uniref:GDSL esterase/lipase At1g71691-like n=1 Tax=Ipomoea nil TaxID=35883 RepID=UPI0009014673|nr:PREDICTED: GDSL esterase/lipase At1g71691-like [Ipomoea nil]
MAAVFKFCTLFILLSVGGTVLGIGRVVNGDDVTAEMAPAPAPAPAQTPTVDVGGLVPAMFIFGDSLIDSGNNNNLLTLAKANYPPYGIDFTQGPTGRFSNGYTIVDAIGQQLGLPLAPAYSTPDPSIDQMRFGVNYASAAAGILDMTGQIFVERVPLKNQITNFAKTLDQLSANLSAQVVKEGIPKCIFFVGIGSNDYLTNYLMPGSSTNIIYTVQQYADLLIQQYSLNLQRLYDLGARKFVLAGIGELGCIPTMVARSENGQCLDEVNQVVDPFNANMKQMVTNFNTALPDAKFVYLDTQNMFRNIIANSKTYGFSVVDRGCCGVGKMDGEITCVPFETPCPNREEYVFWDAYHPTSAVNVLVGKMAFSGGSDLVYPINIQQLARTETWPY